MEGSYEAFLSREFKRSRNFVDHIAAVEQLPFRQIEADLIQERGKREIDRAQSSLHVTHAHPQRVSAPLCRQAPVV